MAGWINLAACLKNPPVTGINAVSSPTLRATEAVKRLIKMYPRSAPTGPADASALPAARNRPVPLKIAMSIYSRDIRKQN
jgi:hypothetical protein